MYINKIDDLLDKIIDEFYARIILKEPRLLKIIKEFNFVKYQSDINDILKNYILTLNLNELKEIIKTDLNFIYFLNSLLAKTLQTSSKLNHSICLISQAILHRIPAFKEIKIIIGLINFFN